MSKKLLIYVVMVVLAVAVFVPFARGQGGSAFRVFTRRTTESGWFAEQRESTTESEFQEIPALKFQVSHRGPVVATVSGNFEGSAPIELRIPGFKPDVARFQPSPENSSFSFTFVRRQSDAQTCKTFNVEFRSPTQQEVAFVDGSILARYQYNAQAEGCK